MQVLGQPAMASDQLPWTANIAPIAAIGSNPTAPKGPPASPFAASAAVSAGVGTAVGSVPSWPSSLSSSFPAAATTASTGPSSAAAFRPPNPLLSPPTSSSSPSSVSPPSATFASTCVSRHRRRSSRLSGNMPEYRHVRGSSLTIPNGNGPAAAAAAASRNSPSASMARSPPNTAHVPCKFFRQGACQAGNACPFSHDLGAAADTICKYFAKGNCKFGPKCANIHVLPDGRRVNYGKNGFSIITSAGGHPGSPTSAEFNNSTPSALTSSLYRNEQSYINDEGQHIQSSHHGHQLSLDNGHPADSPYSLPSSTYGSPRDGLGLSPLNSKGLSILDAPLPASFDSNGISNAARFPAAPWPSSVPSKFGFDSSTSKDARTSDTLKLLHSSAFGASEQAIASASPPNANAANGEEYFGKRVMHSSRYAKPKMLSSSMGNVDRDWEAEFAFGDDDDDDAPENYLPENLQDLLTPAEKARRGSMRGENDVNFDSLSKYGSPIGSSPSRWGPLFQRQKEEEELAKSARNAGSAFGHVGSPLRNSTLVQEMASSTGRISSESMSVLSQQLQRSRLDEAASSGSPHLHPSSARPSTGKDRAMERHVSTGSISSTVTGRFTTPIDEEDPDFVFSMEEEDDSSAAAKMRQRVSAGLGLGSITSYAGAVSSKPQSDAASKDVKSSGPAPGQS